ncbi:unnamed protein product [Notodromas monacha]|uniref:Tudor domain-containing protein n=1 Tax=Notodromas monacha TaxID=399045 RepID=A0A7R9BG33_9CRUS|nr:unnamed protein product [Notodromas monacha]CAG0913829.1 unnamed protein product [Notodromas monacha]
MFAFLVYFAVILDSKSLIVVRSAADQGVFFCCFFLCGSMDGRTMTNATPHGTLLFRMGEDVDDSELIQEYERQESLLNLALERVGGDNVPHDKPLTKRKWKENDWCRAPYPGDGKYYEGRIVAVDEARAKATVRFEGYDTNSNIRVPLRLLHLSYGKRLRDCQRNAASERRRFRYEDPFRRIPCPAETSDDDSKLDGSDDVGVNQLFSASSVEDAKSKAKDALQMSAYMFGFHAGLYEALGGAVEEIKLPFCPSKMEEEILEIMSGFPSLAVEKRESKSGIFYMIGGTLILDDETVTRIELAYEKNSKELRLNNLELLNQHRINMVLIEDILEDFKKSPCLNSFLLTLWSVLSDAMKSDHKQLNGSVRSYVLSSLVAADFQDIVELADDCLGYRFQLTDSAARKHEVGVRFPPNFPEGLPKIQIECPEELELTIDMMEHFSMKNIEEAVREHLEKFVDFWNVMDDIDDKTWVLDPSKPRRSDVERVIYLGQHVSMKFSVDPRNPYEKPEIEFLGPVDLVEPLKCAVQACWDEECEDFVSNLKALLEIDFPQKIGAQSEEFSLSCALCLSYELDGKIPNVICKCSTAYHAFCLHEWILTMENVIRTDWALLGPCSVCSEVIKCPLVADDPT